MQNLLILMKEVLEKYSDEDHPLTTAQIIEILDKEYGMKVHRTTVARDVADLADMGVDVQSQRSTQNRYFVHNIFHDFFRFLIRRIAGTKINAMTHGRMPLNTRSTYSFSLKFVKKMLINKMATNDGKAAPKAATNAPFIPRNLYPTYNAVFMANTPGSV